MAGGTALRWLRASALASVVVLGGLAGHAAAGGVAPSAPAVLMTIAATVVLVAPMLGAPASTSLVVVLVVAGQAGVHLALQVLAPPARIAHSGASMLVPGGMSGMHASTSGAVVGHRSAAHHDAFLALMNGADLAMLVGHLAAAVAVGLWLAAGERAAWSVLALTGRSVADALRELLDATSIQLALAGSPRRGAGAVPGRLAAVPLRASVWDAYAVPRRGPPCP